MLLTPSAILPKRPVTINTEWWLQQNFDALKLGVSQAHFARHAEAEFFPGGLACSTTAALVGEFSWFKDYTSNHLVFSVWANTAGGAQHFLFRGQNATVSVLAALEITAADKFRFRWANAAGTIVADVITNAAITTGSLINICGYVELTTPSAVIYVNESLVATTDTILTADAELFTGHARWGINGSPLDSTGKTSFSIAELFIDIDPLMSDTTILPATFVEDSLPKDLGFIGHLPFATTPSIYCTGLGPGFQNVGRAGKLFNVTGAGVPTTLLGV